MDLSQKNKMLKRELSYIVNKKKNDDSNFADKHQKMKDDLVGSQENANNEFLVANDFKMDHI